MEAKLPKAVRKEHKINKEMSLQAKNNEQQVRQQNKQAQSHKKITEAHVRKNYNSKLYVATFLIYYRERIKTKLSYQELFYKKYKRSKCYAITRRLYKS